MTNGTVTFKVRPLRVGFIVDPSDRKGLLSVLEMNTFLWGGSYNPIIPSFGRTPEKWDSLDKRNSPKPSDIVNGYLTGFDPDIIVPVGKCKNRSFQKGNRESGNPDELIGNMKNSKIPQYGIGIFDLLNDLIGKELKYQRNDDLEIVFPLIPKAYKLFLTSVLGKLPDNIQDIVDKYNLSVPNISKISINMRNYNDIMKSHMLIPRRITSWELEQRPLQKACIFLCDARSTLDIIDYWNLRAAGYMIIPVPIQTAFNENMMKMADNFIENRYDPHSQLIDIYRYTNIIKSRSLSRENVESYSKALKNHNEEYCKTQKYSIQKWYPRIWDTWARENANEGIVFPFSYEYDHKISDDIETHEIRIQSPKFNVSHDYTGKAKFANELSFRFFGSKEPMSEIIPEGNNELSSIFRQYNLRSWRFAKNNPIFLAESQDDTIYLNLPRAEVVMKKWLKEQGWEVSLSGPGRIAKQIMKQLGGIDGISILAFEGIVDLLAEMEKKKTGLKYNAVIKKLKDLVKTEYYFTNHELILKNLIDINAVRLGTEVQCPICMRHNWYELNLLDYSLNCRYCLSNFQFPSNLPHQTKWTYRAFGPFASNVSQGAFTVLLTLRLLSHDYSNSVTPLLSYNAKNGKQEIEADLTCLYRTSLPRNSDTQVIHVECKSFNRFEQKDIDRMKILAKLFPNSVLIFATLKSDLKESETKLIAEVVNTEREKQLRNEQYSPVVVLTGTELFSRNVTEKWEDKGGKFKELYKPRFAMTDLSVLANATQQLYLDLPSFDQWAKSKRLDTNN